MRFRTGGQSGVDRAVLDACLAKRVRVGGWCPEGRMAEDGRIPAHYPLRELHGAGYEERTKANVRDSDGTLILYFGKIIAGTKLTAESCRLMGKPCLAVNLAEGFSEALIERLLEFLHLNKIKELNVAGSRISEEEEAYAMTRLFLERFLHELKLVE